MAIGIAALLLGCGESVFAATSVHLTGSIGGTVRNARGIAQMGATVILYNRSERIVERAMTNADGGFLFSSLLPDLYSVRVTLSSFIPAVKQNIPIQPGFHSVLTINMASMLSSIEIVSASPSKGSLMNDDWKWVLRSSQATRPILRLRDAGLDRAAKTQKSQTSVFSDTRGIVRISGGDSTSLTSGGSQPDLGTAFTLATSVFGANQIEVSGNFGISSQTGLPSAGFSTKYVRKLSESRSPEFTVSMHQLPLPSRGGFGPGADGNGAPSMRSMRVSMLDEFNVMDNLRMEYGASAESVSLVDRLNLLSPFARLTYEMGESGSFRFAYSNGAPATELAARLNGASKEGSDPGRGLATLSTVPRVAMREGRVRPQRTENIEFGYTKVSKNRTISAGAYKENVRDASMVLAGGEGLYTDDVLPDLASRSSVFGIGNFSRWGYQAGVAQRFGDRFEAGLSYGRGGVLTADNAVLTTADADELRGHIRIRNRNWASARLSGVAPVTGTRFTGTYGWMDYRSLSPAHLFLAQQFSQEPGLNISIRQPLPSLGLVPGRFEATAELRNLLEQGYLPVKGADGRTMVLTNAPRAVRGGLSFIF